METCIVPSYCTILQKRDRINKVDNKSGEVTEVSLVAKKIKHKEYGFENTG